MSAIVVTIACLLATLAAAQDPKGIVRRYEEEGLVGQEVLLPCEVDKASCGDFHSIKWYKGAVRVFIFSEMANVKRPEGPLLDRTTFLYNTNGTDSKLSIFPLRTEDQGVYKCEITYIEVREACSVVQFVNLTTYAIPTYVRMTVDDGTPVDNGTMLGPLDEGTTLALSCTSGGGKPVAKVSWWKDEEHIEGDYRAIMDDDGSGTGSNTIRVPLTRADLGARYVCQAENVAMQQPFYTWAEVDVNVAPLEVEVVTDASDLREGSDVTLVCLVTGSRPAASVKWYNGTTQVFDAVTEVNVEEDSTWKTLSRLSFVATRYENQDFTCEASNVVLGGFLRSTHTLDVMYVPAVRVMPENITVNESMDILVFCQYDANPIELISVEWYLNGRLIDVEGNPDKFGNGNVEHPSLLVKNSTDADMGEYTCRVANSVGVSAEANTAYVSVQFRPEVQVLMEPSEPVSEEERLNVTLVCETVKANPEYLTRVRWYLDGDLLKKRHPALSFKELPECDGNATFYGYDSELCNIDPGRLLLENVFRDFHGNYSCEGMNEAGWGPRSQEAELVVLYPPGEAFVTYLPPMVVKGRPVELTCSLDDPGRPAATTFRWYRGSHLVPDVTRATWTINPASLETEDNYTCVPVNSQGEGMNTSVQIDVLAAPTFIERLPPYHGALMNADEVSLSCRVECSPLCNIMWFKDDYPLDNSTHYVVKTSTLPSDPPSGDLESVESVLTWRIEKWPDSMLDREIDNANYTCTSSANRAGPHVTSTTSFRVEYPPEGISVSRDVVEVVEGEEAPKVECSASSFPEATYVWMHGADTVSTGQVLHLNFGMSREKGGEYVCIAENRHGKQNVVVTFDVMFRPECKIDRQDFGDGDEAYILLLCRATANPEDVSFRWRTGNETLVRNVVSEDLESRLRLPASVASLGTYYCYVNNSVGESIPCEIDVTGVAGIFKKLGDDNIIIISAVVVAAIVLVLIICVVIIIICRRQRQAGKSSSHSDMADGTSTGRKRKRPGQADPEKTPASSSKAPAPLSSGAPSDPTAPHNPSNPSHPSHPGNGHPNAPAADEEPTQYENLAFHGLQPPPNKLGTMDITRPPSQLSHQASSGYGSTRSRKDINLDPEDLAKTSRKDVSFNVEGVEDDREELVGDDEAEGQRRSSGGFGFLRRQNSESYGSMRGSSGKKDGRNALSRTAAYFSMRLPGKAGRVAKNQRNKARRAREARSETEDEAPDGGFLDRPSGDSDSRRNSKRFSRLQEQEPSQTTRHVTAESSHTLTSHQTPSALIVETSQTSKLTLHTMPSATATSSLSSPRESSSTVFESTLTTPLDGAFVGKGAPDKDQSAEGEGATLPRPAPRNGLPSSKAKHTYQNIPLPTKDKSKVTKPQQQERENDAHPNQILRQQQQKQNKQRQNQGPEGEQQPENRKILHPGALATNLTPSSSSSSPSSSSPSSFPYQSQSQNQYPPSHHHLHHYQRSHAASSSSSSLHNQYPSSSSINQPYPTPTSYQPPPHPKSSSSTTTSSSSTSNRQPYSTSQLNDGGGGGGGGGGQPHPYTSYSRTIDSPTSYSASSYSHPTSYSHPRGHMPGVVYADLYLSQNGHQSPYRRDLDTDYAVLQFNGPMVGQEIDV